jgi:CRP-like cAMP-binding protein
LFASIAAADCAHIVNCAQERVLTRHQTIFFVGDPIRQLWLLTSGCVKIMQVGPNGGEVILRVAGPGDMIGSFGFSARDNHSSSAQTIHAAKALVWDTPVFEALSERFPALRRNMVRVLCERLQEMDERFREISTEKVASRLSSQLGRLLIQVGRRVDGGIEVGLSREELAQLTGTTLFTVSRMLSLWEQQGIVKARREAVLICDTQALRELAEGR